MAYNAEYHRAYYAANRERELVKRKQYYDANPTRWRGRHLEQKYGISEADYEEMCRLQCGVCAICGDVPSGRTSHLDVDHDHQTGRVRALLCGKCNRAIGNLNDDPKRAIALAGYLVSQPAVQGGDPTGSPW